MRLQPRTSALLLAIVVFVGEPVRATCGSASCFLETGTREGLEARGALHVDVQFESIDQSRKREGSDGTDEVLTPKVSFETGEIEPDHHREIGTRNTLLRLDVVYGITERLSLLLDLPLVQDRAHEHYDEAGTPDESFTNRDGSSGFGDVRLGARYGLRIAPRNLVSCDLELKLPTGSYKLRDSEGNISEPTIQPGTGSVDAIGRVRWARHSSSDNLETFLAASYRANTENDLDYRMADEILLGAGLHRRANERWSWTLQLNLRHTGRDRYRGETVPSTGSDLLNFSPGLRYTSSQGTQLYAFYQLPVYQSVNEAQLTPRYGFVLGVSKTF